VHDELDGNRLTTNELTPFFHCAYDLYSDIAPIKNTQKSPSNKETMSQTFRECI
jgi:hypothetical protein